MTGLDCHSSEARCEVKTVTVLRPELFQLCITEARVTALRPELFPLFTEARVTGLDCHSSEARVIPTVYY